jgi:hypothetical protein
MPTPRPTDDSLPGEPDLTPPGLSGDGVELRSVAPGMSQPADGILRGLGGVVRGLSSLVWSLPLALAIVVWTVSRVGSLMPSPFSDLLLSMGIVPGLLVTTLLGYGVWQVGRFQPENSNWQRAANRACSLSLLLIGLSPFLYWWSRRPEVLYFKISAAALILFGLLFLAQLNAVLRRLTALLPDQALKEETASMAKLNYGILAGLGVFQLVLFGLDRLSFDAAADFVARQYLWLARLLLLLFMVMPLAITIAVMWKIKETILESVFAGDQR